MSDLYNIYDVVDLIDSRPMTEINVIYSNLKEIENVISQLGNDFDVCD